MGELDLSNKLYVLHGRRESTSSSDQTK
jgi:hypothetical protein